jgi:hypothetical protein
MILVNFYLDAPDYNKERYLVMFLENRQISIHRAPRQESALSFDQF